MWNLELGANALALCRKALHRCHTWAGCLLEKKFVIEFGGVRGSERECTAGVRWKMRWSSPEFGSAGERDGGMWSVREGRPFQLNHTLFGALGCSETVDLRGILLLALTV